MGVSRLQLMARKKGWKMLSNQSVPTSIQSETGNSQLDG